MKITVLGCGTSGGVPRVGNVWGRCDPNNPKNRRRRVSILVEIGDVKILVDTSPDLREQLLDAGVDRLNGVVYTHDHADHSHGIDDLRGLYYSMRRQVDIYGDQNTLDMLCQRFDYMFHSTLGYPAVVTGHVIEAGKPFKISGAEVQPFSVHHGPIDILGYRFGAACYTTDLNGIPKNSEQYFENLDLWIVDALRYDPHSTHTHLEQTLEWIARFKPKHAVLTHMNWDMDYEELRAQLPAGVEPGYDGMSLEIPDP